MVDILGCYSIPDHFTKKVYVWFRLTKRFILSKSEEVSRGGSIDEWFEEAVNLISTVSIDIERDDARGLFGIDNTAEIGSIPDVETLRSEDARSP